MKIFNLTDIETPALRARGWVNVPLAVAGALINPGESAEVVDTVATRRDLCSFTGPGALAVGTRPPEYMVAKAKRSSNERLAMLETEARTRRKGK